MTLLPKGSSKGSIPVRAPVTDSLQGSYVQYEDDGAVILAVVTGFRKDKLLVLNVRGRELDLGKGRLYILPGKERSTTSSAERLKQLEDLEDRIRKQAQSILVAEVWEFFQDQQRVYSPLELSSTYFGTDSLERHAGLRVALITERIHFKRDKDGFEPRPTAIVEDLKRAEEQKRKKAAQREELVAFLGRRLDDPNVEIPETLQDGITLLSEVAAGVQHADPARQKEGRELLSLCMESLRLGLGGSEEHRAFEILRRVGVFNQNTNLSFIRHGIPIDFPAAALEDAAKLTVFDPRALLAETGVLDLTAVSAITIDDVTTRDMDDALSLEQGIDGFELGIHITDVASVVPSESEVDRTARRRATSIYCADGTVNMLPRTLSEESLSLKAGLERACLSCIVKIDSNLRVISSSVRPSVIKVTRRFTYEEVDELLEQHEPQEHMLHNLHAIAAACEEDRLKHGAVKMHRREVVPHLEEDGRIRLQEIDEDSPARALVAELMVLANSIFARFAAENKIPVLFRGQERPAADETNNSETTVEGEVPKPRLKKSTISLAPHPHAGLGLEYYLQATSPIRRYVDLCHQRQILCFLRTGTPWLSSDEFAAVVDETDQNLHGATLASKETKRFWLLRYLEQREKKQPIGGTVVRTDLKSPLVELDEVYIGCFLRGVSGLKVGDRVNLVITAIEPRTDNIRFDVVRDK